MKKITQPFKSIIFACFCFIGLNGQAQILSITQTSDVDECDGSADILPQFLEEGQVWTFKKEDGTVLQYGNASSIFNLCVGSYQLSYLDSNGVNHIESFIIGDPTPDPCQLTTIVTSSATSSNGDVCNDFIHVSTISLTPCTFTWNGGITNSDSIQNNLCHGFYYVIVEQTGACHHKMILGCGSPVLADPVQCLDFDATITTTNSSDNNSCDGSILVNPTGGTAPYSYIFNMTDITNPQTSNPLFENLCPWKNSANQIGSYNMTVIDNAGCIIITYAQIFDNNLTGVVHTIDATEDCNGSVFYPSINGGVLPYTYLYSNGETTSTCDSLCEGSYTLTVTDAVGTSNIFPFNINTQTNQNFSAYVIPTTVSSDGICDGSAELVVEGGFSPYSYHYSNGDNTINASNLCGGLNSVTVTDAIGASVFIDFIVPTPSNTASTNNFQDSVLLDSIYNDALINCDINYGLVDSANIVYYTILPNDTVDVTWAVYFDDSIVYINSFYHLDTVNGVYLLTLEVYCPNKSLGNYLFASDQIYYNASYIGIHENKLNAESISIYPNPFQNQLTISLDNNQYSEIIISDITGKVILNQISSDKIIQLDMSNLSAGQYIVTVKNENLITTRKIVK